MYYMTANRNGKSRSSHSETDTATERLCAACSTYRPYSEYSKSKTGYAGYSGTCKPCSSANSYARRLRDFYGLSPSDYAEMLSHQGGQCAICGRKPKKLRLSVDHSHSTQLVRGLLCLDCNSILGMYRDRVEVFEAFVRYLISPPAVTALSREHYLTQSQQDAHKKAKRGKRGFRMRRS